jgi:hypothetical protein
MYFLPLRMDNKCGLLPFNPAQPEAQLSRDRRERSDANFCNLGLD